MGYRRHTEKEINDFALEVVNGVEENEKKQEEKARLLKKIEDREKAEKAASVSSSSAEPFSLSPSIKNDMFDSTVEKFASPATLEKVGDAMQTTTSKPKSSSDILALGRGPINYEGAVKVNSVDDILRNDLNSASAYGNIGKYENRDLGVGNKGYLSTRRSLGKIEGQAKAASDYLTANKESSIKRLSELGDEKPEETYNSLLTFYNDTAKNTSTYGEAIGDKDISGYYRYIATGNSAYKGDYDKVVSAAERYKTEKNPNLKKYSEAVKDSVSLMKVYAMGEVDKYVESGANGETLLLWAEDLRKRAAETTDKTTRKALNERASTIEEYTLSKGLLGSESQAKLRSKRERVMAENEDAARLLTSVNAIIDAANGIENVRNSESPYSLQYYATTTRGKAVVKYLEDNGFSNESLKVASEILTDYKNEYDRANYFLNVSQKEYYDAKWKEFEEENSQNGVAEYEASYREMQKAKSDMDGSSQYGKPYAEASERYAKASVPHREAKKKLESAVGKEAAEEYYEYVAWKLSQEEGKAFEEETKKRIDRYMGKSEDGDNIGGFLGGAGVVGENIATFATNLVGIAYTPIHWIAEGLAKDSDKPFDEYGNPMMTYTNAVRGETGENIENDLARKVYEGVMSSVDSVAMAYLGGAVGKALGAAGASAGAASTASKIATGVTFGISSAENMAIDVTSRGGAREPALASGVVAGIAETLFESWSIGKFNILKKSGLGGFKNFASDHGKGVAVNFSEEGNTEFANGVADILINGGASQYAENVRIGYFSGMSLEDAKREASKQFAWQVLDAAEGGAMQGFLMGSVGGAKSSLRRYVIGSQIRHSNVTQDGLNSKIRHLLDDATYLPAGSKEAEYVRSLSEKYYTQGKLSDSEIGSISEITSNFFAENEGLYREAHAEEYAFSDEYDNAGKKKRRRLEKQVMDEALSMPEGTEARGLAERIKEENGTGELGRGVTMNLYSALLDARKEAGAIKNIDGASNAVVYSDSEKALIEQGVKPELAIKGAMALTKLENGDRLSSNEIDILRSNDVLYGKTAEVIGLHAERTSMTAKGFREAVRGYTDTKQAELAAEVAKASAENGEAAARLEAEAEARAIESEIQAAEAEVRSENADVSGKSSEVRAEGDAEDSGAVSARTAESGEAKVISEQRAEGTSPASEGAKFAEPSENVSVALGKANASAVDTVNTDVASTGKPVTVEGGEAKRYASPSESVSEALAVGGSAQQKNVKAKQSVAQAEQNVAQEERKGDISENADAEQDSYAEPMGSVSEATASNEGDEVDIDIEGESEGESKKPAEVVVKKKSSIWSPIARFFRSGTTAVDIDSDGIERKTGINDSPTFLITGEDRSVIRETAKSLGTRVSYMDDSTAYTSGKNVKGSASASGREVRIFLDNIRREVKARAEANGEVLSEKELNARIASEAVRVTYHEFGHIMEVYAKEAFADFKALAKERYIKKHGEDGFNRAWEELNKNEGRELSEGEVESELACDMIPELLEDKKFLSLFEKQMNRDRTAFGRFLNALGELLSRVRSFFESLGFTGRTDDELSLRKLYIGLRQSFNRASAEYRRQERRGTVAGTIVVDKKTGEVLRENEEKKGVTKHYISGNFLTDYDAWVKAKRPARQTIFVGETSDALQSIGVKKQKITWDTSKMAKTLRDRKNIDDSTMRQIPNLLENPILIMQSKKSDSRIVLFGELYDTNGIPVLGALELLPKDKSGTVVLDEIKVISVYAKNNEDNPESIVPTQNFINSSRILYIDPNKKRTDSWLTGTRLQLPFAVTDYGSIGIISYPGEKGTTQNVKNQKTFVNNETHSTVDTRKLGEELDREKAEGAVADGVTDGDEGLKADGMGDAEGGDEVGERERILPEYNSRGQKVSKFAETVADVGMRLNEAGRTEEGTDMVEAAKRIAENPVEYKTEPMSHEATAKAAERAREKDSDGTEGKTAIIKAIERFNNVLGNKERVDVLSTEDTYNVLYYAEEAKKLGLIDERDELFAIAAENFNRSGRIVELAKLLSEMSGAAYEKYMKRKEENINRTRRGKIVTGAKQKLFDEAVKLGNEKREREGELEKVKAKLARISEKYRKAQAEIARLEAERNSEYSEALFEAEEKLKALGDELVKAKEEAKKAKEAAAKAQHELKAARKELDKMPIVDGEEYGGADSENGEARKKLAEVRGLKKRIRNLEGMIAGKADGDEKKAELEKRVETLKETLKQKEDELRAVGRSPEEVKAIEKLLNKVARLENKVKKLTEVYELSDEEKTKKEQRISELEAEIQSIYNGDGERMGLTELRKQLASAKGKEKRRGERIDRLTKELAEKEAQIEEIARKYPEYEKLIEEEKKLQSRVKYLQKQIDRFADESGKPVDIQAEIDRLNAEIEEKKAEKRAIAEKNPELAKLFEAERRLKAEIREIENYKSGRAQENAKKRIDKLNEKLEKLNKEYASFAEDKEKVRKEVEEAKKKVSERFSDLAILKSINKKLGANAPVFIEANLIEQYRNAEDADERQKIAQTIVNELISEIPHASFLERLTAWKHVCLLGSIKTPERNLYGNTVNYILTGVNDRIATVIETMYYKISGNKDFERTKASAWSKLMYSEGVDKYSRALAKKGKRWLGEIKHPIRTAKGLLGNNLHSEAERESKFRSEVLEFLEKDADMMQGVLQGKEIGDGKGDDIVNMFNEQRRIFKWGYHEKLRKAVNASLETPDLWFLRSAYKSSLLSALAARKIDISDLSSKDEKARSAAETALASARDYAVRRAKEVTFREQNWLADQINGLKKNPIGKLILEPMITYVKTPANVAKQSFLNSPISFIAAVYNVLSAKGKKGNIMRAEKTGNEAEAIEARAKYQTAVEKAIEDTAKGFTGTALCFAGYMLSKGIEIMGAKISLRFGGGDDDDYEDLLGYQDLSFNLEFGDSKYSISLSQFSPTVVPLLIGSLFREKMSEDDKEVSDNTLGALWGASSKFAMAFLKVLVDTTMLSNVDDFISDVNSAQGYTKNDDGLNIMDAGLTLALGYLQQFLVPTYISHLTKAIAGSGMRSYKDKERDELDFFRGVQKRFINKIGGLGSVVAEVADYTGWEVAERLATFKYVDEWGRTSGNDSIIGGVASIVSGKYSDGAMEILRAIGIEVLMPFFASEVIETEADKEILRLREALGTSVYVEGENSYGIYPETAKKTVDFLGGSVRFSAREYEQFATVKGKTQRELIEAAVGREDYQKLSDGEKAKIIDKIYNLAEKIAAKEVIGDKYASGDNVYNTAVGRDIGGMLDILLYENALSEYKADTGDIPSEKEKTGILLGLGYDSESAVGIWRGMVYTGDEKLGKLADKLAPSEAVDAMKYYNKIGKEGAESETEKANVLLEMELSDKVTEGIWKAHIGSETRVELYDMLKSEGLIRNATEGVKLFAEYPGDGYDISLKLKDEGREAVITEILGEKASVIMDDKGTFTAEKYNSMYKADLKKRLGNIVQKYKIVKDGEYLRNLADALEGEVQGAKEGVESAMMDDYIAKGGKITISTSTGVERELSATMSAYYWHGIKEGNDSYKPSAALATYDKNGCVKYGGVVYRNLRKGLFDSKRYADYYVQYYTDYFNDNSDRLGRFAKGSPAAEKLLSGIRGDAKKAALRATDDYYARRYSTYDKGNK